MNFSAPSDAKADQSVVSSSSGGRVEEGDGVGSVSSATVGGGGNKIRGHVSRIAITNSRENITTTDATRHTTSTETTDADSRQINNNFKEFFVSTPPQTHAVRRKFS